MKVLGLITARGGSKGVPGKNWKMIAGRPLIAWTVAAARACSCLDRIVVSTDHEEIAEAARNAGAEVPFMRPEELSRDDSPHIDCVLHALDWLEREQGYVPDCVCLLQPTSPLRLPEDIDGAVAMAERLMREKGAAAVISVTDCPHHPYLARKQDESGRLLPFMEHDIAYQRRQDLPPALATNGAVYVNSVRSLREDKTFYPAECYGYHMPQERSLEIDTPWEFSLVEAVLQMQQEKGA
ncbi:cytidylyltransferase domain-containing protein [Pseudodesulfovibrio senegalensis]|uniref:Acylneuraminate cytidylyltransferase family protein n=1 Tax=Pseudodesulfovibrio senegalensis TaxID=1721087 RepID=A0A6N6N1M2_9BACT|nr:acylneuraminate cytidylyltransferase family protein [Pseudodesulfovibrio senegalensis]KAB1441295.1 acylneuraminate cytidylyltransferase family protein [Pseudodesulfovibrio senegalensis]